MKNLYKTILWIVLPVMDFFVVSLSGLAAYGLYRLLDLGQKAVYPMDMVARVCGLAGMGAVMVLILMGAYRQESGLLNVEEIKSTVKGMTLGFLGGALVLVLLNVQLPRYVLVLAYVLSMTALVLLKTVCYRLLHLSRWVPGMTRRILIYGAGELGQDVFQALARSPKRGIQPVGFVDDDPALTGHTFRSASFYNTWTRIPVLGTGDNLETLITGNRIDEVWLAISNADNNRLSAILERLRALGTATAFVPHLYKVFHQDLFLETLGQVPLVRTVPAQRPRRYLVLKKAVDVGGSVFLLLVLSPLFLWIARAIQKDSPGPVFFRHQRIGLNGKPFSLVKFRTMVADTHPYQVNPLDVADPRITRVGRFLRRTSLDELPQLFNVIRGEMSLVGPRPEMPFIVDTYTERHRQRLRVKPGITGLWQLSGDRDKPIHHNMDYDLYYIRHQSFFLDVAILLETLLFAFRGI